MIFSKAAILVFYLLFWLFLSPDFSSTEFIFKKAHWPLDLQEKTFREAKEQPSYICIVLTST